MEKKNNFYRREKTHGFNRAILRTLFLILVVMVFSISIVSAADWDNIQTYDPIEKKATIENIFGLGDTLAEITLTDNTYNCANFCYAEGETTLYYQRQLIENLRFEKFEDNKWEDSTIKDYTIYINQSEETTQYKDANGTTIINTKTIWEEYNGQVLNPGTYKWRIEGEKNPYDTIDWLGTFFGKEIDEWAIWTGVSNMSFRFENNLLDENNIYNWTNQTGQIFEAGQVGQATVITVNVDKIENGTFLGSGNWTYTFWLKPKSDWNTAIGRVDVLNAGSNMILVYDRDGSHDGVFDIFGGGTVLTYDIDLVAGDYQHFAISHNGTSTLFYVNGSLINSTSKGSYASVITTSFATNGNVNTNYSLDELKYFPEELSATEILNIYSVENDLPQLSIELNTPANNTEQFNNSLEFTMSGASSTVLTNFSISIDNIFNQTVDVTGILNSTTFLVENIGIGNHTWIGRTCNATTCVNSETRLFNLTSFQINSQIFNNETTEGATETFTLNITKSSSLQVSTIDLIYNTTVNSFPYSVSGDEVIAIGSIVVPSIVSNINLTFFWNITFDDGSNFNTNPLNQTAFSIGIDNCSTFTQLIYNFTQLDEADKTLLTINNTMEVQVNLFDTGNTILFVNFSQKFVETNPAQVCLESSLFTTVNYSAFVVVKYSANVTSLNDSYSLEYHNILNQTIGNTTVPKLINLFSLKTIDTTKFRLTFRDSDFILAPDILVQIHRQYVEDNDFKIVEIPITDSNGQTILNLVKNDIVYNLIMVDIAGNVVATFNEITAFCQDFTIGECTINLNAPATGSNVFNYNEEFDISIAQATFNNVTELVSVSFITGDLQPKTVRMEVYRNNQFGNRSVCSGSLTAASGLVSCDVSAITDSDQFLFIDIFVDNELAEQQTINLNADNLSFGVGEGSFYAFLLILLLITLFMEDRQVLIVSLGLGWVAVISLGLMKGTFIGMGSAGIWLLVTIGIFLWKLSKEEI